MTLSWAAVLAWAEAEIERGCNVMFCCLDKHEGDRHVDPTGYGWDEPTPASPVLAHVYTLPEER